MDISSKCIRNKSMFGAPKHNHAKQLQIPNSFGFACTSRSAATRFPVPQWNLIRICVQQMSDHTRTYCGGGGNIANSMAAEDIEDARLRCIRLYFLPRDAGCTDRCVFVFNSLAILLIGWCRIDVNEVVAVRLYIAFKWLQPGAQHSPQKRDKHTNQHVDTHHLANAPRTSICIQSRWLHPI